MHVKEGIGHLGYARTSCTTASDSEDCQQSHPLTPEKTKIYIHVHNYYNLFM